MTMRSKVINFTLVTFLSLGVSACSNQVNSQETTITKKDVTSISVTAIEQINNLRIVALANGAAEIISAMGYQRNLVGKDIASSVEELVKIPVVTSGHQVIPETILALNPDVVIIDAATGPAPALAKLKSAGIRIELIPQSWNLPDIENKVIGIGAAIGATKSAVSLNQAITKNIGQTDLQISAAPKILFLYLRGTSAIYLVGGPGSGADSLIEAIGGVDVGAANLPNAFNPLTAESMAKLNPDIILVMSGGLQSVGGMSGLKELPGIAQNAAGKNSRVIAVDDSLLLSFGPRTPSLLAKLSVAVANELAK